MEPTSLPSASDRKPDRTVAVDLLAIGSVAAAGLLAWALLPGGSAGDGPGVGGPFDGARLVSAEQAGKMARAAGHPVFWAGTVPGMKVAMNRDTLMNVHVRYLPDGADPETDATPHLSVGSDPFEQAFEATARLAGEPGRVEIELPGAVGFLDRLSGPRVVLALKDHPDLQIEVIHPRPEQALAAVRRGAIVPID